jgi:hypothetical protein
MFDRASIISSLRSWLNVYIILLSSKRKRNSGNNAPENVNLKVGYNNMKSLRNPLPTQIYSFAICLIHNTGLQSLISLPRIAFTFSDWFSSYCYKDWKIRSNMKETNYGLLAGLSKNVSSEIRGLRIDFGGRGSRTLPFNG